MYKKAVASFWTEEVDLSADHNDWEKLSLMKSILLRTSCVLRGQRWYRERKFVGAIYAWAHRHRGQVLLWFPDCYWEHHSEMYSLLIDTYVKDAEKKNKLLNAVGTIPSIVKRLTGDGLTTPIQTTTSAWSPLWRESFSAGRFCSIPA